MLSLSEHDRIVLSGTRACFRHPLDKDKVIKTVRIPPATGPDANWKEWRHYQYILNKVGPIDVIPSCHGFLETNYGQGLVFDCIQDPGGSVSRTLGTVLSHPTDTDRVAVPPALARFCRTIIDKNIQLFDLNLQNILIQIGRDGAYRAVSVDLKGRYNNYEFIPVSTYIPYFSRKKLIRRSGRLLTRVSESLGTMIDAG